MPFTLREIVIMELEALGQELDNKVINDAVLLYKQYKNVTDAVIQALCKN